MNYKRLKIERNKLFKIQISTDEILTLVLPTHSNQKPLVTPVYTMTQEGSNTKSHFLNC